MLFKEISFQQSGSLAIVQIGSPEQDSFSFVSGTSAIKQNMLEVKEISKAGSVNNLIIINRSKEFAFFMDGDILEGAKQNRVLNTSVLLAPESKTVVPVSCVERGRWHHTSDKFSPSSFAAPHKLRSDKAARVSRSLKENECRISDQREVWDNVAFYSRKMDVDSKTECLSDVFEMKKDQLEELASAFSPSENACGLALFIKKELMSIDVFGRTDIYRECFPRLVYGAALDAMGGKMRSPLKKSEAFRKTLSLLGNTDKLEHSLHEGAGAGTEKRFSMPGLTGFSLSYTSSLIHLSLMTLDIKGRMIIE